MGCSYSGHESRSDSSEESKNISKSYKVKSCEATSTKTPKLTDQPMKISNSVEDELKTPKEQSSSDCYSYDVNISCHENQLDWVETHLLAVLEEEFKLRCFIFERDRPAGFSPSQIIQDAVHRSRRTIICFSQDYLSSRWKQYEVLIAHHKDPLGMEQGVIPILLDDCKLPPKYSGFKVIKWPLGEKRSDYKFKMRLKFFWMNLFRSLDMSVSAEEDWWLKYS